MPRHLISDVHEWINEIPTVPNCPYRLSSETVAKGTDLGGIPGERRPYWAWLESKVVKGCLLRCSRGGTRKRTMKHHYSDQVLSYGLGGEGRGEQDRRFWNVEFLEPHRTRWAAHLSKITQVWEATEKERLLLSLACASCLLRSITSARQYKTNSTPQKTLLINVGGSFVIGNSLYDFLKKMYQINDKN
jgi:hypothetical protein